jgi:hypothetical protein
MFYTTYTGTPTLHIVLGLAAMPNCLEFGLKSFSYLLQHADLTAKDDQVDMYLYNLYPTVCMYMCMYMYICTVC